MALSFKFDFEATKAALLYLASKNLPDFDKYRAVKLLFLADREHLLRFGRPITGDDYSALKYGPTPNRVLNFLDDLERVANRGDDPGSDEVSELARCLSVTEKRYPTYHAKEKPDLDYLSKTDLIALDSAVAEYGQKDFEELKTFTHGLKAYSEAWRPNELREKFPMPYESFFADLPARQEFLKELEVEQRLTQALKVVAETKVLTPLRAHGA
jgi:Protein of unknown function (DUF4065)